MCGGEIVPEGNASYGTCDSCGGTMTLPRIQDERKANLFNRANQFRKQNDFDKALSAYESILNEDNTDAEAHWGAMLSRFGIEYVEDPLTHMPKPTCHRVQHDSVFADADYLAALEYAPDGHVRDLYETQAKEISDIQKHILDISAKEPPFDVFICYKESTDGGTRTKDSTIAQDIYYQLTKEDYKVFFARITLEDKLGQEYEPYIFAALNSAKVMLVIGTKPEYFKAVWVKNEWSRFLSLTKKDRSLLLIPCYKDMDAYDLPEELSFLQSQDMSKIGFIQDIIRGIKKVLDNSGSRPAHAEETNTIDEKITPLLKRAWLFLEDSDWQDADKYFDKVLDIDPEFAPAYIGKLCASQKLKYEADIIKLHLPFNEYKNGDKALKFAKGEQRQKYYSYIKQVKDRLEKEAHEAATHIPQPQNNTYAPPPAERKQDYNYTPERELNLRKKRSYTTAGLLGIFFGNLGFHNFYMGRKVRGLCQLLLTGLTVVSFGQLFFFALIAGIWGFTEGVLLLSGKVIDIYTEDKKFNKLGAWAKNHKKIAVGGTLGIIAVSFIVPLIMIAVKNIPNDAVQTNSGNSISTTSNRSDSDSFPETDNDSSREENRSSGDLDDAGLVTTTSENNTTTKVNTPSLPYLTDLAPAYQSEGNYTEYSAKNGEQTSFFMGGIEYFDGMTMSSSNDPIWGVYNLNSEYSSLEFVLCHVDMTNNYDGALQIFYDGILSDEYSLSSDMSPRMISLDVNGVSQLKISFEIYGYDTFYGCGNPVLSTDDNQIESFLPVPNAQDGFIPDVSPAYQKAGNYKEYSLKLSGGTDSFNIGGIKYTDGMTMSSSNDPVWGVYNLASQYSSLEFVLGHVDMTNNNNGTLQVFFDGILADEFSLTSDMPPRLISLDVTGVTQLKISFQIGGYDTFYGCGNPVLSIDANNETATVPIPKAQDGYIPDVLPAYQKAGNYHEYSLKSSGGTDSFYMGGIRYTDGITMSSSNDPVWGVYNLASQYSSLEFVLSHIDKTNNNNGNLQIFYDGVLHDEFPLTSDMSPRMIALDVTGVSQLKISFMINGYDTFYGCGNPILSVDSDHETALLPIPKAQDGLIPDVLPAYQNTGNYKEYSLKSSGGTESFYMSGVKYTDGITMSSSNDPVWGVYNLSSQYRSLEFSFGHIDDTNNYNCKLQIYCDGNLVSEYSVTSDTAVKNYTIDLTNVTQLKIVCNIEGYDTYYGFGNPTLKQ
jgi:tetratricopeptide (TPR) repeat protein/TM2 domain-containing membrane protein YozV